MPSPGGDRSKFFPAIEKKHGGPISAWIERLSNLGSSKYEDQMAFLQENHGFSRAHANALVMYVRGSATSRRFATPDEYFSKVDAVAAVTSRAILDAAMKTRKGLELVIAWNQPMLRIDGKYVLGLSVAKNHITISPFSADVLERLAPKLAKYQMNKKTFKVPLDWKVDATLVRAIARARLDELG